MPILKIRSKQRYDTEANWSSKNPVLLSGELAISSDKNGRYKVGDGTNRWSALDYAGYKIGNNITDTNGTLSITKTNVTNALGYTPPTKDTTYSVATQSANGLMSSTDKKKLDEIASGAEVNQNAFGKVVIGDTAIEADTKIDTLTLVAGTNVTLSPDDATDGITISSKDTIYTHPTYTSKSSGLYKITVDGTGHVSAATAVAKSDITALGIPGSDTDTHYTSKNVVGSSTATSNTTSALTNGNVYLNSVENGAVTSTHKISGSGATTVTTDTSGNIVISSTDNNTTYDVATSSTLGLVKSGTDITVDSSGNMSVNNNSHTHTVSNISDLTATAAELNVLDGITASTTELNYVDGVTSNIQTQLNAKAPLVSPTLTGTPKAPTASAGTNTTQIATTAFVQTAVSNGLAASDAMIIKGTIGTDGTVTALPTTYKTGWTYRVITAGTYAGQVCEIGDLIIALVDRSGSGNANTDWCVAQTNINGAITGVKGDNTYLSASQSGSVVTLSHKDVTRSNSTSTASPSHGGTFTAVKSVSSDAKGHITGVDTETVTLPTYSAATQSANGLMSSTDKKKLDGIASGAEVNQNAFSNVIIGNTTVSADTKTDSLTLVAGSNVTLTADATNDKITIASKDTVYTHPTYASKSSGLYKITVDGTGHVSAATAVAKSDITALGIPGSDTNTWRPLGTTADTACAGNDSRLSNSRPASDVYAWAKASSKPSYSWSEITSKPSSFTPASHTHTKSQITDFPASLPASGGTSEATNYVNINNTESKSAGRLQVFQKSSDSTINPDTGWWSLIRTQHPGYSNGYWQEIALPFSSGSRPQVRQNVDGTKSSWKELAYTSDIPSSLKNPYTLTIKQNGSTLASYDGSSTKTATVQGTVIAASAPSGQAVGDFWIKTVTS